MLCAESYRTFIERFKVNPPHVPLGPWLVLSVLGGPVSVRFELQMTQHLNTFYAQFDGYRLLLSLSLPW